MSRPKCAICSSPARTTASIGGGEEGAGRTALRRPASRAGHALDHADFHAALGRALQLHVVHEVADEEDAAAARLEQVLRRRADRRPPRDRSRRPGRGRGSPARGRRLVAVSNSTNTCLAASLRLPCLIALMTDSRIATPTQWSASSSRPTSRDMWSLTTCTKSSISNALVNSRRTT